MRSPVLHLPFLAGAAFALLAVSCDADRSDRRQGDVDGPAANGVAEAVQDTSALLVAIMRWDGVVAPFAAFEKGEWVRVERDAFEERNARSSLDRWYFHARRGSSREVRVRVIVDEDDCLMHESWGQSTDLQPDTMPWQELLDSEQEREWVREWAGRACPMSRIGIALSEDRPLVRMVEVDPEGSEARRVLERVRTVFDERETGELRRFRRDGDDSTRYWTGHPVSEAERAGVPIRLTMLRRVPSDAPGPTLYQFIVMRNYDPVTRNGTSCRTESILEGFLLENGSPAFAGPSSGVEGACSESPGMQGLSIDPYGLLQAGGKWYLLGLEEGYEWSAPMVLRVTESELSEVLRGWEP